MWVQFLIGGILMFFGFAIHKLKWYFLISGYNTMSKAKKANVDKVGLGRLMGFHLYFIGGLLMLMGVFHQLNLFTSTTPFLVLIVLSTISLLIKAQKYDHNLFDEEGHLKEGAGKRLKMSVSILLVTFLAVGGLFYYVTRPIEITFSLEGMEIHGLYGEGHLWNTIDEVELYDELPQIQRRTNGAEVGASLRGHFRTAELGDVKLFVNRNHPLFIYMTTQSGVIIFNGESEQETRQYYEAIVKQINHEDDHYN